MRTTARDSGRTGRARVTGSGPTNGSRAACSGASTRPTNAMPPKCRDSQTATGRNVAPRADQTRKPGSRSEQAEIRARMNSGHRGNQAATDQAVAAKRVTANQFRLCCGQPSTPARYVRLRSPADRSGPHGAKAHTRVFKKGGLTCADGGVRCQACGLRRVSKQHRPREADCRTAHVKQRTAKVSLALPDTE
jgi:hypothetical protein